MAPKNVLYIIIVLIILCGIAAKPAALAEAQPQNIIGVNTLSDTVDDADGKCSLREAIINANNGDQSGSTNCTSGSAGSDEIRIQSTGIILLGSDLPAVTSDLTIKGNPSGTTIAGDNKYRILKHDGTGTTLILQDLTLKNGNAGTNNGGGVLNYRGLLEVHECTFFGNSAKNGGAIDNVGNITLIKNSTFIQNSADHPTETASGGAVRTAAGWSVTIINSTFDSNYAKTQGSTLFGSSGYINVRNSIIAFGEQAENCSGFIDDDGNNIDTGISCGFVSGVGSFSSTDPFFGDQGHHGGPTGTIALLYGSPAIDGITYNSPNDSDPWDQRHYPRPVDGNGDGLAQYDIGAFESDTVWELLFLPVISK